MAVVRKAYQRQASVLPLLAASNHITPRFTSMCVVDDEMWLVSKNTHGTTASAPSPESSREGRPWKPADDVVWIIRLGGGGGMSLSLSRAGARQAPTCKRNSIAIEVISKECAMSGFGYLSLHLHSSNSARQESNRPRASGPVVSAATVCLLVR